MVAMGAPTLNLSHARQQASALPPPLADEVDILFYPSIQAKKFIFSKAMRQLARQDTITQWAQLHSPILQHVQKVIQAEDSACLSHLSRREIKGHWQHSRFDLPPDKVLRFRPTVFLGNMHSMVSLEFSSVQLGQLFRLLQFYWDWNFHSQTLIMEFVSADKFTMSKAIIDSSAQNMLANLVDKDTTWWCQHLALSLV
jgi:hypothetical protein